MSATVIQPSYSTPRVGVSKVTIAIPTTVDGSSGATCNFQLLRCMSIDWMAVSANFNAKTVELKASNDGTNFYALAVASQLTASGNKPVPQIECGYTDWQISITGAPVAAMVVVVVGNQLGK